MSEQRLPLAALQAHFPDGVVKTADKGRKGKFRHIDARDVYDRLDEVVGPENWSTSFRVLNDVTCAVECALTVCGVSKADVGYPNNPAGATTQRGDLMTDEPLKEAYSDAVKRAGVQWGIARYLYQPDSATAQSANGASKPATREAPEAGPSPRDEPRAAATPQASPNKPASANQLATVEKLSRLLGHPVPDMADWTSADASASITNLSDEYNRAKGQTGRRAP